MAASNIEKALNELDKTDVYSMILFALYKLREVPEYLTLSELSYILDNKSLLNFLDYYGGMTLTVPTKKDFDVVINALLLYQDVNIENIEFSKALRSIDKQENDIDEIKKAYFKLCDVLKNYEFKRN